MTTKPAPLIELQGLSYQQNNVRILQDVHWRVRPGEHWAVLGPNGGGKSTLLRVACGYLWPTGGRVLRGGQQLANLVELRRSMGWVGEERIAQFPKHQTALQITASGALGQIGLRLVGQVDPTAEDLQNAYQMLRQLGCGDLVDRQFSKLSQGERQKVLVAHARMMQPNMLVLDEPCAGMDPGVREEFLAWLQQLLVEPDTPTVLLVTHHVEEIMPGIDQTLIIRGGRIAATGPTGEVVTSQMLADVFGVQVAQLVQSHGRLWPIWGEASPARGRG